METIMAAQTKLPGGGFLVENAEPESIYTPEDFSQEHIKTAEEAAAFMENEILPHADAIEAQEPGLIAKLLKKAGESGLLSIDVPTEYGGSGLDLIHALLAVEQIAQNPSFTVAHGAHTSIGTLPTLYFGTEAQKRKYLPKLATGEFIGAFALTERGAGSDALSAKTTATLSADGTYYLLNGEKMWIGNAGIADLFTVFGKVDGEKFTAFLVERDSTGVSTGAELPKMGIRGASTRPIRFENVKVPVENVLGEIGSGHLIAFNILNSGRLRLGAMCIGTAKSVLRHTVKYAKTRKQFGRSLAEFGLIQHKLAEMATRIYVSESMVYRAAGDVQAALSEHPDIRGLEEYAIESSILKVAGSETLDYVVDEGVQIYGGYGFSEDLPMARAYRDARINRIFEGTNEINRLFIPTMLMRRVQRGRLSTDPSRLDSDSQISGCKRAILYVFQQAVKQFGEGIAEQQELLAYISDMIIETYAIESTTLRTQKLIRNEATTTQLATDMTQTYTNDALWRIQFAAQHALAAIDGSEAELGILSTKPLNTVHTRRRIAEKIIEMEGYTTE
jgi:alkylation response protein AidB-like acyl-CoA dehydrogenase